MMQRDRLAGILFLLLGGLGLWFGRDLPMGTLRSIGSGFLPKLTFCGLTLVGLLKLAASAKVASESVSLRLPRSLLLISAAFVVFGLLIETWGLIVSVAAMLAAVEMAGAHRKSLLSFGIVAISLVLFSVAVFKFVLGIPLEVLPKWM